MERRSALKNIGAMVGYTVAAPTLLSVLQGCKEVPFKDWAPKYFTKDQGTAIARMVDLILPKTDTPSGTELNLHVFIDEFVKNTYVEEDLTAMDTAMNAFFDSATKLSGKKSIGDLDEEDLTQVLTKYLKKRTYEEEEAHEDLIDDYKEAIEDGKEATLDPEIGSIIFAHGIRDLATWGYKCNEEIGENVLKYDPVPGKYVACDDVDKLTGGMAWSL